MLIDVFRNHRAGAMAALLLAAAAVAAPGVQAQGAEPAAQDTDAQNGTPTTTADAQTGTDVPLPSQVTTVPGRETRPPRWEFVGGFESDSHDTSYGFLGPSYHRPLGGQLALKFRVHATHLRYEFENGFGGETRVSAPGIGPGIGLRYGGKNWVQFTTGVDIKREHREITGATGLISDETDTKYGVSVGADSWLSPTRRSNIHAMLHYGAASKYTWGRLMARHQVTNFSWRGPLTLYLGAEGVGQGNEDIRSWQFGGIGELVFARTQLSLQARGGYKRSTFDRGPDKTGPYFGVGLWKRFGDR